MDIRLAEFLKTKEVDKSHEFTHTSKIKPYGRYYIPDEDLGEFYKIYNNVVTDGGLIGITENPQDIVPLIVDVDLRYPIGNEVKRAYTPKHIASLVAIYQEIICEIVEEPNEKVFYCCVLEKSGPTIHQGSCKDGFHLHFPYFYTEKWVQKDYIRTEVLKRVEERKIFDSIQLIETLDKVFDKNIPAVCWLMYGSRKDIKSETYKVTKRYNKDLELLQIKDVFKPKFAEGTRAWNMPRYLSIRQNFEATPLKPNMVVKKFQKKKRVTEYRRSEVSILEDLVACRPLLEILNDERTSDYSQWNEIGRILHSISEGHFKGLDLWIEFSKRCSDKFQEGVCEKMWENFKVANYTIGTLKYLAKKDSPRQYEMLLNDKIDGFLAQGVDMSHNVIANIIYILYENEFKCVDIDKEAWYIFKNHRWQTSPKGIDLRTRLSHELANMYGRIAQKLNAKFLSSSDDAERQSCNAKMLMIIKLIAKLKTTSFKNCIMKEAMEYFYDREFVHKMDENPNLLVCENGVYDAENKIFRDGRPDDYCTKSTNLYYREYRDDDPIICELNEIFRKIFVNPKVLKFFKQTVGDLIKGGNRHKIFVIWTGHGNNGKSVCADFIEKALGDYYYTPPTSMLTGKQQQSSGATSELMPCKGARAVVLSETGNADVLNCGTMKKLTGGDPFYARGNFKEATKIIPQFKLILHCNKMPDISAEDNASWNRIRVIPFDSKFVQPHLAPTDPEEQFKQKVFPMDASLKDRIKMLVEPFLGEAFLWWLIREYENFSESGLDEPAAVKTATDAYHKTNDFYMQFLDERIQTTDDKKDFITLTIVYALFKEWFKDSFPGRTIPSRQQVKEAMEKKLGQQVKGVWRGVATFDPDATAGIDNPDESTTETKIVAHAMKKPSIVSS